MIGAPLVRADGSRPRWGGSTGNFARVKHSACSPDHEAGCRNAE
jgi:hypothetical protein